MLMPPNDPSRSEPLDHPTSQRAHRVYAALTNQCNRTCPWCSTCSSPRGTTFLSVANYLAGFPAEGIFQMQLEGGEPTIHPQFWQFVQLARDNPRCERLVLCTNGVVLPRDRGRLQDYVRRLGAPLTIKLSINHYLLDHDDGLMSLAMNLRDVIDDLGGERLLVLNVRLRRGYEDDDRRVRQLVEDAGLLPHANVFYLQRYGLASGEENWEAPVPVRDGFSLLNPDGMIYGPDLIARSEGMRRLP